MEVAAARREEEGGWEREVMGDEDIVMMMGERSEMWFGFGTSVAVDTQRGRRGGGAMKKSMKKVLLLLLWKWTVGADVALV